MSAMQGAIYPDLEAKAVIVTGGASGIGEAIVRQFARQRSKTAFLDLKREDGRRLAESLGGESRGIHFEACDITRAGLWSFQYQGQCHCAWMDHDNTADRAMADA
jgi:NAD(P)-dependent dehydrogenase (short-subunit alcohol dehydrogenase family)